MVELQLPKLAAWVRFPSPAPNNKLRKQQGRVLLLFWAGPKMLKKGGTKNG
jgi:hypothetical protein